MTLIHNHIGGNRIAGGRLVRRLGQLYLGLALYGASMALMIESTLGLDPWDVFHQGIAETTGLTIGTVAYALSIGPLAQLAIAVCTVPEAPTVPLSGHRSGRFRRLAESADVARTGSDAARHTSRTLPGEGKRSPIDAPAGPQVGGSRVDRAPAP